MRRLLLNPITWVVSICLLCFVQCQPAKTPAAATVPEGFQLEPGFSMELFASEPLLADPVDMEIDEQGRLFVVEMPGYPLDLSRSGRIKQLLDTDGDGLPDKSILFADSLTLPTGIMRWKNGFLVTDAPDVLYLEDTDQDGKADKREVILTGFALSNPQHNFNNPIYGLDNWIYLANEYYITTTHYAEQFGDKGSEIFFPKQPKGGRIASNGGDRNVRFKPESFELEMLAANSQYGHTFDPWGHHFQTSNADPLFHEAIAARYLQRNPDLMVADARQYLPEYDPAEVFPITKSPEHQLLTDVGVVTSACGIEWYQGGQFPALYDSVVFVLEPVHNLVIANVMHSKGATFSASRMHERREFLASEDSWFRPVNSYIGPDGSLYLLDYRRQIIEHPEWMSDEVNNSGQLYNGSDQGRIYRIRSNGAQPQAWLDKLSLQRAQADELARYLDHSNIWWRRTAQRLLLDQQQNWDETTLEALSDLVINAQHPAGRVHALWTLQGAGKLPPEVIRAALTDPVAGVRENAVKLAELQLAAHPQLLSALEKMVSDSDPKVRYQLLCTLGGQSGPAVESVRNDLLWQNMEDEWFHLAALAVPDLPLAGIWDQAKARFDAGKTVGVVHFAGRLAALSVLRQDEDLVKKMLFDVVSGSSEQAWWRAGVLDGLAEGSRGRRGWTAQLSGETKSLPLQALVDEDSFVRTGAINLLRRWGLPQDKNAVNAAIQNAVKTAGQAGNNTGQVAHALEFLSLAAPDQNESLFKKMLSPDQAVDIQLAALKGVAAIKGSASYQWLLGKWPTLTPELRNAVVQAAFSDTQRMHLLLDAVAGGKVDASAIEWPRQVNLMNNDDEQVRQHARQVLAGPAPAADSLLQSYLTSIQIEGDWLKGKAVFEQSCALCHQIQGDIGHAFGPDLDAVRNRTKAALIEAIVLPGRSIADGYELWTISGVNGEVYSGVIASETANSLSVRMAGGAEQTIDRSTVQNITASPVSAMPPDLYKQITPAAMADLLAFLKNEHAPN